MKNTIAIIALLACGVIKEADAADAMNECLQRAQTAYASVYARDDGRERSDLISYVEANELPKYQPIFKRIINKAYDNPKLTKSAAYNGEFTYCLAHQPKNAKEKVVAK